MGCVKTDCVSQVVVIGAVVRVVCHRSLQHDGTAGLRPDTNTNVQSIKFSWKQKLLQKTFTRKSDLYCSDLLNQKKETCIS